MDLIFLAMLIATGVWTLKARDQRRRIRLLGSHLGKYQIEKNMETLTEGYLRALGEDDSERREQIFNLLRATEQAVCSQFSRFAADFAQVSELEARVSKLPIDLPLVGRLLPSITYDMRQAIAIHARGIQQAVEAAGQPSAKAAAFTVSAELFLMQHSCHWFCRSKTVASARMMARHKTAYAQLVAAVTPGTREAYCALVA